MKAVTTKRSVRFAAKSLCEIAMFVALMTAGARISIPFFPVALTFQTVFAVLAGLLLGAWKGTCAMLIYAFMGLLGLPVFSDGGGIAYVLKPSFGYIVGFVFSALVGGLICKKTPCSRKRYLVAAVLAMTADYAVGIAYFIAVWVLSGYAGLGAAIVTYNLLYIPKDLALCALAALLAHRVAPVIRA